MIAIWLRSPESNQEVLINWEPSTYEHKLLERKIRLALGDEDIWSTSDYCSLPQITLLISGTLVIKEQGRGASVVYSGARPIIDSWKS